jgi:hypothetical protein
MTRKCSNSLGWLKTKLNKKTAEFGGLFVSDYCSQQVCDGGIVSYAGVRARLYISYLFRE